MLKLAFSTLPCGGWTPEKIIKFCTEFGFDGLEIREGTDSIASLGTPENELKILAHQLHCADICVTDIGSSVCFLGLSDEKEERAIMQLKESVCLAEKLYARGVRVFLGNFARRFDTQRLPLDYSGIVRSLKESCRFAKEYETEIWIETHNEFSTGAALRKLLEDVDMPNCKIIWDVMHSLEDGESPEDTLKSIGNNIAHVHLKDGVPFKDPKEHDWEYTAIGQGIIPIGKIIGLLINAGYSDFFSLEWENKWRKELMTPRNDAELVIPFFSSYMREISCKMYLTEGEI